MHQINSKSQCYSNVHNCQKNCLILAYSSTSSGVVRKMQSNLPTFLRFCSSFSLEYNFSLVALKYSLKFMATNVHQSRFLNNHQSLEYTTLCL